MADMWPRLMKRTTAAAYLDVGMTKFDEIVNLHRIDSVQPTPRGDRQYLRDDLDAYLDRLRESKVKPRAA